MHPSFYHNSNKHITYRHWPNNQRLTMLQFVSLPVFLTLSSFHLDIQTNVPSSWDHNVLKLNSEGPIKRFVMKCFPPLFCTQLSFTLIWNKLKASNAHHSCANVGGNQYASCTHSYTNTHTYILYLLQFLITNFKRSSVVALRFPPVQLAGPLNYFNFNRQAAQLQKPP